MLLSSRVVLTRRENIVVSPAVYEIPFEKKVTVVSFISRKAIVS